MDAVRIPVRAAFFALLMALALALAAFLMVAGLPSLGQHQAGTSWHKSQTVAGTSWHKVPSGTSWH